MKYLTALFIFFGLLFFVAIIASSLALRITGSIPDWMAAVGVTSVLIVILIVALAGLFTLIKSIP